MTIMSLNQAETNTEFDTVHYSPARLAGGHIELDVEHVEWLGSELVTMVIDGTRHHFNPHEARDLAAALQNLATHIDESVAR